MRIDTFPSSVPLFRRPSPALIFLGWLASSPSQPCRPRSPPERITEPGQARFGESLKRLYGGLQISAQSAQTGSAVAPVTGAVAGLLDLTRPWEVPLRPQPVQPLGDRKPRLGCGPGPLPHSR